MKKIFAILMIIFGSLLLTSSYAYAKKCQKCKEDLEKNKTRYYNIGIACRDFTEPIVYKDGKAYAVYKCQYGHRYLVCLDD